jgi:hypothetical protein
MADLPTSEEIAELVEFCRWERERRDILASKGCFEVACRALAIAEKLPALVAEINHLSAECARRGKEVMRVYAERDRFSYKLHASMDGSAKHGYVEECRLLSAERDRLAAEVEKLTKERDEERNYAFETTVRHVRERNAAESSLAAARETIAKLQASLRDVREFVADEVENRDCAGGDASDYVNDAKQALEAIDEALAADPLPEELAANDMELRPHIMMRGPLDRSNLCASLQEEAAVLRRERNELRGALAEAVEAMRGALDAVEFEQHAHRPWHDAARAFVEKHGDKK